MNIIASKFDQCFCICIIIIWFLTLYFISFGYCVLTVVCHICIVFTQLSHPKPLCNSGGFVCRQQEGSGEAAGLSGHRPHPVQVWTNKGPTLILLFLQLTAAPTVDNVIEQDPLHLHNTPLRCFLRPVCWVSWRT